MKYIKTFEKFNVSESLNSQKNIEKLAKDILLKLAKLSFNTVKEFSNQKRISIMYLYWLYFKICLVS